MPAASSRHWIEDVFRPGVSASPEDSEDVCVSASLPVVLYVCKASKTYASYVALATNFASDDLRARFAVEG